MISVYLLLDFAEDKLHSAICEQVLIALVCIVFVLYNKS